MDSFDDMINQKCIEISISNGDLNQCDFYIDGYDEKGFDKNGFDENGIHNATGIKWDIDGNDKNGFDENGIHKITGTCFNVQGFTNHERNENRKPKNNFIII